MSRIIYTPRTSQFRKKKRMSSRTIRATLLSLALLMVLGGTVSLLRLSQGRIDTIEISGTEQLDATALRTTLMEQLRGDYFFLIPKNSFFTARAETLASDLRQRYTQIKSIAIDKKFPRTLAVTITERELFAIFCPTPEGITDGSTPLPACAFVDSDGFAYESAPRSSGSLILKITKNTDRVDTGTSVFEPALLRDMQFLKDRLSRTLELHVTSYRLASELPHEIRVSVSEGFDLWFDRTQDLTATVNVLKTVLDQEVKNRQSELAYVDLRFGNKVFYKFKGK